MLKSVQPDHVAVKILKSEKDFVFYKDIIIKDDKPMRLQVTVPSYKGEINHYEQGVSIGQAVLVGSDVKGIDVGDLLLIDYSVDVDDTPTLWMEGEERVVACCAINTFYEDDLVYPASRKQPYDQYDHVKGDVENFSPVYGVIKDNDIIPNWPYVILEYKLVDGLMEETESGISVPVDEGDMVIREVAFTHPDSPMKPGDKIAVMYESLFEREVGGKTISICMERDILTKLVFE